VPNKPINKEGKMKKNVCLIDDTHPLKGEKTTEIPKKEKIKE